MPEVSEQPKTASLVGNEKATPLLSETYGSFIQSENGLTPDEAEVKNRVNHFLFLLKESHPKTPEIVIDNISQIYAGPLLKSIEHQKGETADLEQYELSARIQQHLTHLAVYASEDHADAIFQERFYKTLSAMEKSANSRIGRNLNIRRFLNGVKSEISVIKTLHNNGYEVYIPDYIQKSDASQGKSSETMDWDVKFGTDLVGVSPTGEIFLIDAKGRKMSKNGKQLDEMELNREPVVTTKFVSGQLPGSLQKLIDEIREQHGSQDKPLRETRIVVPTADEYMKDLDAKTDDNTYQEIFRGYAALNTEAQNSIIEDLER